MNEFEILILAIEEMTKDQSRQKVVTFHNLLEVLKRADEIQESLAKKEKAKMALEAIKNL